MFDDLEASRHERCVKPSLHRDRDRGANFAAETVNRNAHTYPRRNQPCDEEVNPSSFVSHRGGFGYD